jgi:AraC-like DNA-binding protein
MQIRTVAATFSPPCDRFDSTRTTCPDPVRGYNATVDGRMNYRDDDPWGRLTDLFAGVEPRPAPRCGHVRCEPGWRWQVALTDYDLWLAVAGRGRFVLEQQSYPIRPGTLFWLRPGDGGVATQDAANPLTVVYVHFDFFRTPAGGPVLIGADLLPGRHIPLRDWARVEMALARVVRLQQLPAPLAAVEARLLLHQAILEAYRQDATNRGATQMEPDPRIAAVLTRLHRQPAERLSLARAAALAGVSTDHFSRLFSAQTGTSFRRYAIDARLERARHLVEETTLAIGEIALAMGYDDVFLFSRQFKARYGVAPTHLRSPRAGRT